MASQENDGPAMPVIQSDRDVAAYIWFSGNSELDAGPRVREMRTGQDDACLAVQAVARYRHDLLGLSA